MSNPKKPNLIEALAKTHKSLWMDTKQNIHLMLVFPSQELAITSGLHVCRVLCNLLKRSVIVNLHYLDAEGDIQSFPMTQARMKNYKNKPAHVSDGN